MKVFFPVNKNKNKMGKRRAANDARTHALHTYIAHSTYTGNIWGHFLDKSEKKRETRKKGAVKAREDAAT